MADTFVNLYRKIARNTKYNYYGCTQKYLDTGWSEHFDLWSDDRYESLLSNYLDNFDLKQV